MKVGKGGLKKAWDSAHRPVAAKNLVMNCQSSMLLYQKKEADELVFHVPSKKPGISTVIPAYK